MNTFKRKALSVAILGGLGFSGAVYAAPEVRYVNTLTGMIPNVYEALDIVARELVGFIPAVNRDSGADRAAVNQPVIYHKSPAAVAEDIVPGQLPPDTGDQVFGNGQILITKSRAVPFRWNGEEQRSLGVPGGITRGRMQLDQIVQAFRTLANEVETDVATTAYKGASRAYGTAGAAPFGTAADLSDTANSFKILDDNGAPRYNRKMVLGTAAMTNLRAKQSGLFKVNEAGTEDLLRNGIVARLQGFDIGDSAQVQTNVKGTGAGYTSTAAGFPVGTTIIPVITGAGTFVVGDTVTFAGDTNKYVVTTALGAPGNLVIAAPGLRQALPAVATAVTIGNNAANNLFFGKHAIQLVTRLPALPDEGDMASDRATVTDPVSGLVFEIAMYKLYRRVRYEIALAWGQAVTKTEHVGILLG